MDFDWLTADMEDIIDAATLVSLDGATDATRKTRKIYDYALGCVVERYEDEIEREMQKHLMPDLFQYGA